MPLLPLLPSSLQKTVRLLLSVQWLGLGPIPASLSLSISFYLGAQNQETENPVGCSPVKLPIPAQSPSLPVGISGMCPSPMPQGLLLRKKLVHSPFRTWSQHGSTEDVLFWQVLGEHLPPCTQRQGSTESLPVPSSHQTLLKAGFTPECPVLGPPKALVGFVCVLAAVSHPGG